MAENSFDNLMHSMMQNASTVITSKTVMGDPITVGDTILIPMNEVTIGCGAGADNSAKKNNGGGGFHAKMTPSAVLVIRGDNTRVVSIKDQNSISRLIDLIPEVVDKFTARAQAKDMMSDEEAKETAFPGGDQEETEQ